MGHLKKIPSHIERSTALKKTPWLSKTLFAKLLTTVTVCFLCLVFPAGGEAINGLEKVPLLPSHICHSRILPLQLMGFENRNSQQDSEIPKCLPSVTICNIHHELRLMSNTC